MKTKTERNNATFDQPCNDDIAKSYYIW